MGDKVVLHHALVTLKDALHGTSANSDRFDDASELALQFSEWVKWIGSQKSITPKDMNLVLGACAITLDNETSKLSVSCWKDVDALVSSLETAGKHGVMASCLICSSLWRFQNSPESNLLIGHEKARSLFLKSLRTLQTLEPSAQQEEWRPQLQACLRMIQRFDKPTLWAKAISGVGMDPRTASSGNIVSFLILLLSAWFALYYPGPVIQDQNQLAKDLPSLQHRVLKFFPVVMLILYVYNGVRSTTEKQRQTSVRLVTAIRKNIVTTAVLQEDNSD